MTMKIKNNNYVNLPNGYTQLEYIESSGTQYIDTGISFDASTDVIETKYFIPSSQSGSNASFGYCSSADTKYSLYQCQNTYIIGDSTGYVSVGNIIQGGQIHTFKYSGATIIADGTEITVSKASSSNGYNIYIGCYNYLGTPSVFTKNETKYYSFKIKHNNILVRDFIPAKRISDDVVGMYDLISNAFFINARSGNFIAGNEVSKYREVHELYTRSKNLFNKETAINGDIIVASGEIVSCNYRAVSDYIKVKKGQTYMASGSFNMVGSATIYAASFIIARYDANKNYISGSRTVQAFPYTIPSDETEYLRLEVYNNNISVGTVELSTIKVQLEEGSSATSYVPYISYIGETYQKNPEYVLPDGYTQLEYIESTNARGQCILTNVIAEETDKISIKALLKSGATGDNYLTRAGTNTWIDKGGDSSWYIRFGSSNSVTTPLTMPGTIQIFELYKEHFDIDGETKLTPSFVGIDGDWSIFSPIDSQHSAPCDLYSFIIKNNSTNEIRFNGIPAKRNSDNAIGIYDLVSNSFKQNAFNNPFIAGNEVPKTIHTFSAGYDTTISGVSPLALTNSRAKNTSWEIDGNSKQGVLPDGYTQLEYIQSTDTGAWINSGISTTNNIKIDTKFTMASESKILFGGRSASSGGNGITWGFVGGSSSDKTVYNMYGSTNGPTNISINVSDNNSHTLVFGSSIYTIDEIEQTSRSAVGEITESNDIYIGTWNTTGTPDGRSLIGKIYYFKIYNELTGALLYNGVACKNNSDVVGLYDTISGTFKSSIGTAQFTAGPSTPTPDTPVEIKGVGDSRLPSGYKKLEYIQSSGTQYIDTGKSFSSSTDTLKVVYENAGGTTSFKWAFGCYGGSSIGITTGSNTTTSNLYYSNTRTVASSYFTGQHTFLADSNGVSMDGTNVASYVSFSVLGNVYLFATNNSGTSSNFGDYKIYSYKQTRDGVNLINLIPAQRISDSVVGMYDTVTNTFYTNSGTGTFTAGPEDTSYVVPVKKTVDGVDTIYNINLPAPLQKISTYKDSIESDGMLTRGIGVKVLDGTSNWRTVATGLYGVYFTTTDITVGSGISTHAKYNPIQTGIAAGLTNGEFAIQVQPTQIGIMFKDTTKTLEEFVTLVTSSPISVYYPLATPTEETISVPTITTNKGTNYIDVETDIAPSNVSVTYRKKTR